MSKGGVAALSRTAKRAALASTRAARRPLTRGARQRVTSEAESMLSLHRPPWAAVHPSLLGAALRAGSRLLRNSQIGQNLSLPCLPGRKAAFHRCFSARRDRDFVAKQLPTAKQIETSLRWRPFATRVPYKSQQCKMSPDTARNGPIVRRVVCDLWAPSKPTKTIAD